MITRFHPGEQAVQRRVGTQAAADRVGRMVEATIPPAAREFLSQQTLVIVGANGLASTVWASLLTGPAGFLQTMDGHTLQIHATPLPADPLAESLRADAPVGLLAIEFETRKRMRINGRVTACCDGGLTVRAEQVYANCPKYIRAQMTPSLGSNGHGYETRFAEALTEKQRCWISQAHTFFIASTHPDAGADVSHRGGPPGFIAVADERTLIWPDYTGNNLFQTLGNLEANPRAGLLFVDFAQGATLQCTGEAQVIWDSGRVATFDKAARLIEYRIDRVLETTGADSLQQRPALSACTSCPAAHPERAAIRAEEGSRGEASPRCDTLETSTQEENP